MLIGGAAADRIPQRYIMLTVEVVRGIGFAVGSGAVVDRPHPDLATGADRVRAGRCRRVLLPGVLGLASGVDRRGELLAANGIEGVLRPTIMQAAGPAAGQSDHRGLVAGCRVRWWSPLMQSAPRRHAAGRCGPPRFGGTWTRDRHPLISAVIDIRDGFSYMVRTRWLLGHPDVRDRAGAGRHGPDRGAAPVRRQGSDRRRCRCFRRRAGRLRHRRRGRFAGRRVDPDATSLPDPDDPGVGVWAACRWWSSASPISSG